MRYLLMAVIGIVVGAVATVMVLNALRSGTAFPRGVMAVSGYHMGQLREAAVATPCRGADAIRHLQALRVMADDIEPAFLPDGMQDPTFSRYVAQQRQRLDAALAAAPGADCETLKIELGNVNDGCKACHRDYK